MDEFPPNERPLRRGDVVHERDHGGMIVYGRVWRRFDSDHVVVIDCDKHVTLYREDELALSDYTGKWRWQTHPGNDYGRTPRWIPMTSLRMLKAMARHYSPDFGGRARYGQRWTKAERIEAFSNPQRFVPTAVRAAEQDALRASGAFDDIDDLDEAA